MEKLPFFSELMLMDKSTNNHVPFSQRCVAASACSRIISGSATSTIALIYVLYLAMFSRATAAAKVGVYDYGKAPRLE